MQNIWLYSIASILVVSILSFVGIVLFSVREKKLKKILLYLVGFSTGALLGDAFIHLLPSITESSGFTISISIYVLVGIAFSFIVEKIIHWHHCHYPNNNHVHPFAITNLLGDSVHNLLDGIVVAAGYLISIEAGIATTIAVVLHEIPQEIADFAILLHGGFTKAKALFFNFLTALTSLFGLVITLLIGTTSSSVLNFLVPFSAGSLIYIAAADLIPELHKEVKPKRSLLQFALLCIGIIIMLLLLFIE